MANDAFGLIGKVLGGQFRVDEVVGEGGFSVVYKGFHLGLKEPVAIKCLRLPQLEKKELADQFAHRFRDESRIAYRLSQGNLNIVRSITSGTTQDARGAVVPYMVLEWLNGRTLADDLRERRAAGQRGRSVGEVLQLFGSVAEALSYAHSHGVIHRDVKPQNLFLADTREGARLKVLDFGMAKILSDGTLGVAPLAQSLGTSVPVFSPPYAAPEQFDWKVGLVGTWTDVYSLALILLEAMADKRVRTGESLAECMVQACDPKRKFHPRDLGAPLGDAVSEVLMRALALKPKERPQDMNELWNQLLAAQANDAARSASIPVVAGDVGDEIKTAVTDTRSLFSEADLGRGRTSAVPNTSPTAFQPVGSIVGETPSDAPTLSLRGASARRAPIPKAAGGPAPRSNRCAWTRRRRQRLDQALVTAPPVHESAAPNSDHARLGPIDPQVVAARAAAMQAASAQAAPPPATGASASPSETQVKAAAPRPAPLNRTLGLGAPMPAVAPPAAAVAAPPVAAPPPAAEEFGPDRPR
ncbi:MAG: serine/threonine-protein kinase [Polyangiaceae bacterium]